MADRGTSDRQAAHYGDERAAVTIGGSKTGDGTYVPVGQQIGGSPSVPYDAVAVLAAETGALELASVPTARDFVTDAYAHCKFIGRNGGARPLFEASGLPPLIDDGFISLDDHSAGDFFAECGKLRFWLRELASA